MDSVEPSAWVDSRSDLGRGVVGRLVDLLGGTTGIELVTMSEFDALGAGATRGVAGIRALGQ
jgi:hypothetical protein